MSTEEPQPDAALEPDAAPAPDAVPKADAALDTEATPEADATPEAAADADAEPDAEAEPEPEPEPVVDPGPNQGQLDDLQDRIDAAREVVNDGTEFDEDEPQFIDSGEQSDAVDDTIAPPG